MTACRDSDSRNNPRKTALPLLRPLHFLLHVQGAALGITLSGKSSAGEPSHAIIGQERGSCAPYLLIISSSVSCGPRLFIYVETHRCSGRSQETSWSICSNSGDPPTSSVIGPERSVTRTVGARVERHLMDRERYCTARD